MSNFNRANAHGREIRFVNSTAHVVGVPCSVHLSFRFGDYGNRVNLIINGQRAIANNLADLDGQQLGGVGISVHALPVQGGSIGLLETNGQVTGFAVGGADLYIDQLCVLPCQQLAVLGNARIISATAPGSSPRTVVIEVEFDGSGNPVLQYSTSLAPGSWSVLAASVTTPTGRPNIRRFTINAPVVAERVFFRFTTP